MHDCHTTESKQPGTRRTCRACKNRYMKIYRQEGRYAEAERERYLRIKNTPMEIAKRRVYVEVRAGRLPHPGTLRCADCADYAQVYAHSDYARPLAVSPICRSCNKKRGPVPNSRDI